MSVLENTKHEAFAQAIARGEPTLEAFVAAGYKPDAGNARRLRARPWIKARVAELMKRRHEITERVHAKAVERIVEREELTRQWVLDRLVENANRALQAQAVLDNDGAPTGVYKYDGAVANRALELLGKELGMFVEKSERLNVNWNVSDRPLTEDEWTATYCEPAASPSSH